jgi:hypothetical protein
MSDATETLPAPPPAPEEPPMEIHKPKPVHNWREFLSEVGVVVLGICIALTGEQAIEWLHWRSEVQEARQAIHAEIAADAANPIGRHLAFQPCLDRQLQEAEAILADLEAHRPPGHFTSFHSGFGGPGVTAEWDAQRAAQTLAHFPPQEVAMMGSFYDLLSTLRGWNDQEAVSWADLAVLRNPPSGLAPGDLARLHGSIAFLRRTGSLIAINTLRVFKLTDALGIPRAPADQNMVHRFCTTNEEEYLQGVMDSEAAQH